MLVLQRCSDPLHILPGSSSERNATSDVCNFSNIKVEQDVDVIEEIFIAINEEVNPSIHPPGATALVEPWPPYEEVDRGIKQEEIPGGLTFPDINSETDEVSCLYMWSVIGHILSVSRNLSIFVMSVFLAN